MQTVFNYSMWFYLIWQHSLYCLSTLTQAHFQYAAQQRGSKCQAHGSIYPEREVQCCSTSEEQTAHAQRH